MVKERNLPVFIVLCLVTFGIYPLIWTWQTINGLQNAGGASTSAPTWLQFLLCFLGSGFVLFAYNANLNIANVRQRSGRPVMNHAVPWMLLGALIPIVMIILVQMEINDIVKGN